MEDKILMIIPTKKRLNDFIQFADSWVVTNSGVSDIIVCIDNDDNTYEDIKHNYPFQYRYINGNGFMSIVNQIAVEMCDKYKYIGFIEDDCVFLTKDWDSIFISKLKEIGDNGIVWGNDLLNKDRLVGIPVMSSSIISRLGYMSPPELKCLFVDNFWLEIGRALNSLYYFDDVVIEHRHYSTNKRSKDDISVSVDGSFNYDNIKFNEYMGSRFNNDVLKLKKG
jgi:hypothetical protein